MKLLGLVEKLCRCQDWKSVHSLQSNLYFRRQLSHLPTRRFVISRKGCTTPGANCVLHGIFCKSQNAATYAIRQGRKKKGEGGGEMWGVMDRTWGGGGRDASQKGDFHWRQTMFNILHELRRAQFWIANRLVSRLIPSRLGGDRCLPLIFRHSCESGVRCPLS